MSRTKKSRKPSTNTSTGGFEKADKKKLPISNDKKPKNRSGKKPGNRQQEALQNSKQNTKSADQKDPRIGNKTPIVLTKAQPIKKQKTEQKISSAPSPIAAIRTVETTDKEALEQELSAIEQNEQLQQILDKQTQDIALTEAEVDLFNTLMDRHQAISNELGIEQDTEESGTEYRSDEKDLWDKFDNNDLSDYQ